VFKLEKNIFPVSSLPFIEANRIASYTSSEWKTLIDLHVDPDYVYYVFDCYVVVSSLATPEGYVRILSNGTPILREYGTDGGVVCYYWGHLRFKGKYQKSPLRIDVHSDGSTAMDAEGWVSGIKIPLKELKESE